MDISRLRKKHRESQEREKAREQPQEAAGETPAEEEAEEEYARETAEPGVSGPPEPPEPPASKAPPEAEDAGTRLAAPETPEPEAPASEEKGEQEEDGEEEQALVEFLTFDLSDEHFAFRVTDVQEVLRSQKYTAVPRTTDFIVGITSLRGTIIPVMSLKKRLRIAADDDGEGLNIVILKGEKRGLIGAFVDRTTDVIRVPESEIMMPPSHLDEQDARFIEGVIRINDSFISIIDTDELLNFKASGGTDEGQT